MMPKNCNCGHHGLSIAGSVLMWAAAVFFFWSSWNATGEMFGQPVDFFFQAVVVLALLGIGMKNCKCCCSGEGCGKNVCGDCGTGKEKMMNKSMCSHADSCTCGDCEKCK
jgi:hypothetical protein